MLELIVFSIVSIFVGAYLEAKKYHVATVIQAVVTAAGFVACIFGSNDPYLLIGSKFILGDYFELVHGAFMNHVIVLGISMSSLMFVEIAIVISIASIAVVTSIRGYRKLASYLQARLRVRKPIFMLRSPTCDIIPGDQPRGNPRNVFLVLGRLRN